MIEFETQVSEIIQRTQNVKSFRFKSESNGFKPGQFFFVTIKINGVEKTKHFSFSNSPTEGGYVEFTKRITDSEFSQGLDRLKPGDWAKIKMPFGSFTFTGESEKIAFLSGGIGITPIRSMCRFIADRNIATDVILLYGSNTERDIIFKDDFYEMGYTSNNMRIVHTLTSEPTGFDYWQGKRGFINEQMIKEEISDYKKRVFYVCGPHKMVEGITDMLGKLGVKKENIKKENFSGYQNQEAGYGSREARREVQM